MGDVFEGIAGLFDDGGRSLLQAAERPDDWRLALHDVPPDRLDPEADPLHTLARIRDHWFRIGDPTAAQAAATAVWRRAAEVWGEADEDTLVHRGALGTVLDRTGRRAEGLRHLEAAWKGLREALPGDDIRQAIVAQNLAYAYLGQGDASRAETALHHAWRIRRALAPHTNAVVAAQLGELLLKAERFEAAADKLAEAWRLHRDRDGGQHPKTLARARTLAMVLTTLDRHDDALEVWSTLREHALATGHVEARAEADHALGRAAWALGRREQAVRHLEDAVRLTRQLAAGPRPHDDLADRLQTWAGVVEALGRPSEAEGLLLEAIEAERLRSGDRSAALAHRYAHLGAMVYRYGRLDDALGWYDTAANLLRSTIGDEAPDTYAVAERLVDLLLEKADDARDRLRDRALALEYLGAARGMALEVLGRGHPSHRLLKNYRI